MFRKFKYPYYIKDGCAYIHPDDLYILVREVHFMTVFSYPSSEPIYPGEIGRYCGLRIRLMDDIQIMITGILMKDENKN